MAPRVDRTVVRVSPPGGSSPDRSARTGSETDRDLARTPKSVRHIRTAEFLSLFKGQGAAAGGDRSSSTGSVGTAPAGV